MPRTIAVECPGCPPLRAITFDVLGLVKVVEARGNNAIPQMVERWGVPDPSRCVTAVSFADRNNNPLLAVARKNSKIEVLNPLTGTTYAEIGGDDVSVTEQIVKNDPIVGLHLFKGERSNTLLTCTENGNASLRSFGISDTAAESTSTVSPNTWKISGSGTVLCSSVDGNENYALFGGKGIEVNVWDFNKCCKIWTAKPPPRNSIGIFTPTWFTAATFLCKEDHRKIVAGTKEHQVRLYDISAQRRSVLSFDFRESPIKAVTNDQDGYTIYLGTGSGDLASFDMRTGKLLGTFVGKSCGSIRSIVRHPEIHVLASCGLDSYLRFWDTKTRQLLSAVFLKQHLTNVVLDSAFTVEVCAVDKLKETQVESHTELDVDPVSLKRRKTLKEGSRDRNSKVKSKRKKRNISDDDSS